MWLNTIIENNHSIPQGKWNHNTQVNTKIFCIARKMSFTFIHIPKDAYFVSFMCCKSQGTDVYYPSNIGRVP